MAVQAASGCSEWGLLSLRGTGFSLQWLLIAEHGPGSVGSAVIAHGPLWRVKSSWTGDQTCVTCVGGEFLTTEPLGHPVFLKYN